MLINFINIIKGVSVYEVYIIENKVNNKKYIGYTKRGIQKRFNEHRKSKSAIGDAIRKYGKNSFEVKSVYKTPHHIEIQDIEKYYISFYNTYKGNGYNQTPGGDGGSGYCSEEHKKILSELRKGVKRSEEDIKKIRKGIENRDVSGSNNGMYKKGYKVNGAKNGRHKDNFKGDISKVSKNIKKGLAKNNAIRRKEQNTQSKKFTCYDTINKTYTLIDKGYLNNYIKMIGASQALRKTLKTKRPMIAGRSKGLILFEGHFKEDFTVWVYDK